MEELTSTQNPKLKAAMRLMDRRERDETGLFLIEGYREISRAIQGGVRIKTLFVCPALFLGSNERALIEQCQTQVISCAKEPFAKLSYRDRPDGLIAVAYQMRYALEGFNLHPTQAPFFVVAESIEKPGNLGTILRSCDAAGVHAALICDRCTDLYNPNVVRASVGTLFTVPAVEVQTPALLSWLRAQKIQIVAATPSATQEFTQADLTGPIAIAVGTEQLGLSKQWMESADIQVRIPMRGVADSLNVATATTLLLYEAVRQRRGMR